MTGQPSLRQQDTRRVRLVGAHPHRGATGTVRADLPMLLGMWKVELDGDNRVGATACYAGPDHLIYLDHSEDPHA